MTTKRMMPCPFCWAKTKKCKLCDGKGTIPDEQLSKSFWLSELLRSSRAVEMGVPNVPTETEKARLRALAVKVLQPIRDHFGVTVVSSGLRSQALNDVTPGSSKTSAHRTGDAVDFTCRGATVTEVVNWIITSDTMYDQVIHEGSWTHIGHFHPTTRAQRRQALRKVAGKYETYKRN